ncbi:MAG: YIP1 family protein [Candidatus Ranarchaeia archaeon]
MKCKKCGKVLSKDDEFCPYCGEENITDKLEEVLPFFKPPKERLTEPMSSMKRIFYILIKPIETFYDYSQLPDRIGPMLVFLLLILSVSLYYPAIMSHFIFPDGGPPFIFLVLGSLLPLFLFSYIGIFANLLALVVLLHIGSRLSGSQKKISNTFGLTLYSLAPLAIYRSIIVLVLYFGLGSFGSINWSTDLSLFFESFFISQFWGIIILIENLILIWVGLVAAIGIKQHHDLPIITSIIIASISLIIYSNLTHIGFLISLLQMGA